MKQTPAYISTSDSITLIVNGRPYTINKSNVSFNEVQTRLANEDFEGIENLFDTGAAVGVYTVGNIVVKDGTVLYKNQPVNNHVVDRILDFMRVGSLSYKPLVNFLDKLMANPSQRAVEELYMFLAHKNMPLTPDGNFLAYKSVRADFTDHHTGTVDNHVGAVIPRKERNQVCDNADIACDRGYHCGSLEFAKGFSGNNLVIVEINPADVVSIPKDANCQKLRCTFYKVVGTFERPLDEPLVSQYDTTTPDETESESAQEQELDDSYEEGYNLGWLDSEANYSSDPDYAWENEADVATDKPCFVAGYDEGFSDQIEDSLEAKPKAGKTSQVLKRDSKGRFV
jgi:hypothetical protein